MGLSPPFAVACHRPRPRWPGSPLCDKVPSAPRQAAPRAPCLTLVGSGFPMRHRLVGLPLSPRWACPLRARPGTARPGVRPRAQEGGLTRPPRGGPSPAAAVDFQPSPGLPFSRDSPGTLPGLPARGSNRPIARQPPRPLSFRELTAGHAVRPDGHQAPPVPAWPSGALTVGLHARIHCPAPPAAAARSGMHLGP